MDRFDIGVISLYAVLIVASLLGASFTAASYALGLITYVIIASILNKFMYD